MATDANEVANKVRGVVTHYLEALSLPLSNFAEASGVDPSRLGSFMRGSLQLSAEEIEGMGNLVSELSEGEDWDVYETKMRGLTPPRTGRDIAEGR